MDTPIEEQQMFQNVTSNIAASEHEITEPNTLSIDFLSYVSHYCWRDCSHVTSAFVLFLYARNIHKSYS